MKVKFLNHSILQKTSTIAKEITTKSKNKDTKKFVSEYLNGFEITKEESKLVNDLCEVGSADGDFDDIEKKYIGFIVEELGLSKEK